MRLLLRVALLVLSAAPLPPADLAAAAGTDPVGGWPLDPVPEVAAGFDPPAGPYGAGHRGVDLLGAPSQPVRAALPGTVSFAGSIAGRGVVVVAHGATRTTYQPVGGAPPVGTPVAAGATIGSLQAGPSHCAPRSCLHWGWIEGETYLDPLRLVGAGPVRLLPLAGLGAPAALGWSPWSWPVRLVRPVRPVRAVTPVVPAPPRMVPAQARGWAWR